MFYVLILLPKFIQVTGLPVTYSVYNQDYKATNSFLAAIDSEYIKKLWKDGGQLGSKPNSGQLRVLRFTLEKIMLTTEAVEDNKIIPSCVFILPYDHSFIWHNSFCVHLHSVSVYCIFFLVY